MQILQDRRALHRIPELGSNLPKTMQYLENALRGLSCKVFSPMESALCAWFDFGKEKAIAFRADADALPVTEKTKAPYASAHDGAMHACGHDGHMAILLELARRLDGQKAAGSNVLLVFQPAEETTGGAKDLCDTGVFETYGVEAVFGLHLWPGLAAGTVASREGEMLSRASEITVAVTGRSAHIAKAAEGIDAMAAVTEFYSRAVAMEQSMDPGIYRLLKFGKLECGTVRNAIAGEARLEGSLRTFDDAVFAAMQCSLQQIATEIENRLGCQFTLHYSEGYPAVVNPPELYKKVRAWAAFDRLEAPSMIAEDFSWYQRHLPGMFFFLGIGDTPALHADTFDFDETILLKGADFFEKLAVNYR